VYKEKALLQVGDLVSLKRNGVLGIIIELYPPTRCFDGLFSDDGYCIHWCDEIQLKSDHWLHELKRVSR